MSNSSCWLLVMMWSFTIVVNLLDYVDDRKPEPGSHCSRGQFCLFLLF